MTLQIINRVADGPIAYREAWEWQRELVAQRAAGDVPDTLLLLTHPPTVTYGKTADPKHRLLSPEEYARRGIKLVETDRGGDVTYHGPGQLVGYPILHLGENRRDLHRYVRGLEGVVLTALSRLDAAGADRAPFHAGIWAGDGYVAALGVRVSRWVTHHGFALNVTPEVLPGFATIVPCGVPGKYIETASGLAGRDVTVAQAGQAVAASFENWWQEWLARS